MFERVPRLKAVLDDPRNSHHRRFIERGIAHQRPMVIAIRDGFNEPLMREVTEHEVRKQGESQAANIRENISSSARCRFAYAKYKLVLPDKPAMDMIEFAIELGKAVDSLSMGDFKAASFHVDFSPDNDRHFLHHFSLGGNSHVLQDRNSRMNMSRLTAPALRLRAEFLFSRNLQTFRDAPDDETTKQWIEKQGVQLPSLAYSADGTVSFTQNGCKRSLNLRLQTESTLASLYNRYLNPIAYRIVFAFNPEL